MRGTCNLANLEEIDACWGGRNLQVAREAGSNLSYTIFFTTIHHFHLFFVETDSWFIYFTNMFILVTVTGMVKMMKCVCNLASYIWPIDWNNLVIYKCKSIKGKHGQKERRLLCTKKDDSHNKIAAILVLTMCMKIKF